MRSPREPGEWAKLAQGALLSGGCHGARDVAMFLVGCVPGVLGIRDEITVISAGPG